jgi:hypothetical protein
MKGKLVYYRSLDKKGLLTKAVLDQIILDFSNNMQYAPEEIVARSDEVGDDIRDLVTEVTKGCPPGHVIVYPVISRTSRRFYGERNPQ